MTSAAELIGALGGVISPARVTGDGASLTPGSLASGGFEALLELARGGEAATGRPVIDAAALGLDPEDMRRIGDAIDRAQAAGMDRALVLLGGTAYEVDVENRTVLGERTLDELGLIDGIDGVVDAGDGRLEASTPEPGPLGFGPLRATNDFIERLTTSGAEG